MSSQKMERLVSFRLQKRVNIIFIELDIFIFVICGLREILRVPWTKITFKRKWKIVMIFLFFYYTHHFPARGKEAEVLETGSSCVPGSEVALVWPPCLGSPHWPGKCFDQRHSVTPWTLFVEYLLCRHCSLFKIKRVCLKTS